MTDVAETDQKPADWVNRLKGYQDEYDGSFKTDKVVNTAHRLKSQSEQFWSSTYYQAAQDLSFYIGNQWSAQALEKRAANGRPALLVNTQTRVVKNVAGFFREVIPYPRIKGVDMDDTVDQSYEDGGKDVSAAEAMNAVIEEILDESDYAWNLPEAFDQALESGFSWLQLYTARRSIMSFETELRVRHVKDRFSVLCDPMAEGLGKSDMNWGIVEIKMSKDDYEERYGMNKPDAGRLVAASDRVRYGNETRGGGIIGLDGAGISTGASMYVWEFWIKTPMKDLLFQIESNNGRGTYLLSKFGADNLTRVLGHGARMTRSEEVMRPIVSRFVVGAEHILEEKKEWPGMKIPLLMIPGHLTYNSGDDPPRIKGITSDTRDLAKVQNMLISNLTGHASNAFAPFIQASTDQMDGNIKDDYWDDLNKPTTVRLYSNENGVPPPHVVEPSQVPVSEITSLQAVNEIERQVTGVNASSFGEESNETSARAIGLRDKNTKSNNSIFLSSINHVVKEMGRQFIELVPLIYTGEKIIRIAGRDDITQRYEMSHALADPVTGEMRHASSFENMRFDVAVELSFGADSLSEEAIAKLQELIRDSGDMGRVLLDLLIRNTRFKGRHQAVERIIRSLPYEMLTDNEKKLYNIQPPPPSPEQIKAEADIKIAEMDLEKMKISLQIEQIKLQAAQIAVKTSPKEGRL